MQEFESVLPMDGLIAADRTSITRYEAVECLMLLSNIKPPRLVPLSENATVEEEEVYASTTILDLLRDGREAADAEYSNAVDEGLSIEQVEAKLTSLKTSEEVLAKAHQFLCIIDDELSKGVLRAAPASSNSNLVRITVESFKEWVRSRPKPPRTKGLRQEEAIKEALLSRGYILMELPKPPKGRGGPCAAIRHDMLARKELFKNEKVLQKAWRRLLRDRLEIAYK